jgi:hypothetical protein
MRRAALILVVLLAACGNAGTSSGGAASFKTPAEIAAAISAKGVGCTDYAEKDLTASASNEINLGNFKQYELGEGDCTVNGEKTKITVFKDSGAKGTALGMARTIGCAFAKGFGVTGYDFIEGPTWMVSPKTKTTVDLIQPAIGGNTQHVDC